MHFSLYCNFKRSSPGEEKKNYLQGELEVLGFRYTVDSLRCVRQLGKVLCINVLAVGRMKIASLLILESSACVLESGARKTKERQAEVIEGK